MKTSWGGGIQTGTAKHTLKKKTTELRTSICGCITVITLINLIN
jgi:hypothetical protein